VPTGEGSPNDPPQRSMTPALAVILGGVAVYAIGMGVRLWKAR
jgi:hypothetical protein